MFIRFIIWLAHSVSPEKRHRGLNYALIFSPIFLLFFFLAGYSYFQIHQGLTELTLARRQSVAVPVTIALKEKLDHMVDLGVSFSIHPSIRGAITNGAWKDAKEILQIFKGVVDEPFVDRIFLTDPDGTLMVGIPETGTEGQNFSHRDWYQGILNTSKPYVSGVYRRAVVPQYNVMAVAIPIPNEKGLLMAIMVLQVKLDNFLEWSKQIDVGPKGFVYIVDQKGNIAAHPKYPSQGEIIDFSSVPTVKSVIQGRRGVEITYNQIEKEERLVAYEPVPTYGWGIIVQQPTESAFASRDSTLQVFLQIYVLIFLIVILLVAFIFRILVHYQDHHDIVRSK